MGRLTDTGFQIKTFSEIKKEIEASIIKVMGPVNFDSESVFGQLSGVFTERIAITEQEQLALYNSFSPDTATGASLDGIAALAGITRLSATYSRAQVLITAINQTTIPQNSIIGGPGVDTNFILLSDIVVSNSNCKGIYINLINEVADSYIITINNEDYKYVPYPFDNKISIMENIVDLINGDEIAIKASIVDELIYIYVTDKNFMNVTISSAFEFNSIVTLAQFKATEIGSKLAPAYSLTTIRTPVNGWIDVNNDVPAIKGRDIETDEELRLRRALSIARSGSGSPEAIRARLLDVEGVVSATVIENITSDSVRGIPPHAFESTVVGGLDEDVGSAIWYSKPAGIQPYGNTLVTIEDIDGNSQVVGFSRPVNLYIFVNVNITKDGSNSYPATGDSYIKEGILKQIRNLNVGQTIIYQSFFQTIYNVPGIASATIQVGSTTNESVAPSFSSNNINVNSSQAPVSDITKINVVSV